MLAILSIWARLALSVLLWIVLLPVMILLLPFRTDRSPTGSALRGGRTVPSAVPVDSRSA
jgi:hypothetical protein